jgi:hypothetical protein
LTRYQTLRARPIDEIHSYTRFDNIAHPNIDNLKRRQTISNTWKKQTIHAPATNSDQRYIIYYKNLGLSKHSKSNYLSLYWRRHPSQCASALEQPSSPPGKAQGDWIDHELTRGSPSEICHGCPCPSGRCP